LPAFAPPTWMVVSFIAIRYNVNILALALVGAVAATLGRIVLAKLSDVIVRQKFLSEATKQNIDHIKLQLEKNRKLTFGLLLVYLFMKIDWRALFVEKKLRWRKKSLSPE